MLISDVDRPRFGVAELVVDELEPSLGEVRLHDGDWLVAPRGAPERDTEAARRSAAEREPNAVDDMNLSAGCVVRRRLDASDPRERRRDITSVHIRTAARDDGDPADDLAMSANVAGNDGVIDVGVLAHEGEQMLGVDAPAMIELEDSSLAREGDAFEDLLGSLGAEPANRGKPAVARGFLELLHVRDLELLVDLVDLLGREAGNREHVEQALGGLFPQLVEVP